MISQTQCVGCPPPNTWADYRRGCVSTFHGGYHGADYAAAFRHGMETVFNLLEAEFPSAELCKTAMQRWEKLRDNVLSDPDMDNDTINWALGHIDALMPAQNSQPPERQDRDKSGER